MACARLIALSAAGLLVACSSAPIPQIGDAGLDGGIDAGAPTATVQPEALFQPATYRVGVRPPPPPTCQETTPFTLAHNTAAKQVTLASKRLAVRFDYDHRAALHSLLVDGEETLDARAAPVIAFVQLDSNGSFLSSDTLAADPMLTVTADSVTATYSMQSAALRVDDVWTLTLTNCDISLSIRRTYHWANGTSGAVRTMGLPRFTWKSDAWDYIRRRDDGGALPVGGAILKARAAAAGTYTMANLDRAFVSEQGFMTYLRRANPLALTVDARSATPAAQPIGTSFYRSTAADNGVLQANVAVSMGEWKYSSGIKHGYGGNGSGGHFSPHDSTKPAVPPFAVSTVPDNTTVQVDLTLRAATWSDSYDIGAPVGLDGAGLSALVNDFGRAIMGDVRIGASAEASFTRPNTEVPSILWPVWSVELLQDRGAFAAVRNQLSDVASGLQAPNGALGCCYPFSSENTPVGADGAFGYALGVSLLHELAPNNLWLATMKSSVEKALDHAIATYLLTSGPFKDLFRTTRCTSLPCAFDYMEWNDQYLVGIVSGWQNVLTYAALTAWADLEAHVLNDAAKATSYGNIATALKAKFNANGSAGGFWSPATNAYFYTRDANGNPVKDCFHLFVNAYPLMFNLVEPASRRAVVAASLKAQYDARGWSLHGSNPVDCSSPAGSGELPLKFPAFENGGAMLQMEQPAAQIGLVLGDRSYAVRFAKAVIARYATDNFWGWSNLDPSTGLPATQVFQEPWFSTNVLGVWSLYHDVFGFQPTRAGLVFAPFIDATLVGSKIRYRFRGESLVEVKYAALEKYEVTTDGTFDLTVRWLKKTPGQMFSVLIDGVPNPAQSAADGSLSISTRSAGTHLYELAP